MAKSDFTHTVHFAQTVIQNIKQSNIQRPDYVRRGANGLELVQRTNGHETITPVRATGHSEDGGKRLVIGYEPRAVFVNGELKVF